MFNWLHKLLGGKAAEPSPRARSNANLRTDHLSREEMSRRALKGVAKKRAKKAASNG